MLTKEDLAKYPFTREAAEYVRALDLNVAELAGPEYIRIVERAEQRISEALLYGSIGDTDNSEKEMEILSFPVAVLFVAAIGDNFLTRRYALSEAKRAYELLKSEDNAKLIEVAGTTFGWRARVEGGRFFLSLIDYLRNSTGFHEDEWKLVNKTVVKGEVLLRREEFARLLQEEVRRRAENRVEGSPKAELNAQLTHVVERINQILVKRREEMRIEELPKSAVSAAYPPCVKRLYDSLLAGQHLSHMGRFALTSFLLSVGVKAEDLVKLYTSVSDFDEKLTRYQIEHIAGEKGSRTKYTPPNCGTLKTHGLCVGADDLCEKVRHPLTHYRRKLRLIDNVAVDEVDKVKPDE